MELVYNQVKNRNFESLNPIFFETKPIDRLKYENSQEDTETAYLLRSPKNAQRLFEALESSFKGEGKIQSLQDLKNEVNLE